MDLSLTPQEEAEILEMFYFESSEMHQRLDELLTALEANTDDQETINEILRITHTLKGNAMGMNFKGIADVAHVIEEVFETVNSGELKMNKNLFSHLFKASDKINQLIKNIKENKKVSHKGIKTKLEVIIREAKGIELDKVSLAANDSEAALEQEETQKTAEIPEETPAAVDENEEPTENIEYQQETVQVETGSHAVGGKMHEPVSLTFFHRLSNWFKGIFRSNSTPEEPPIHKEEEAVSNVPEPQSATNHNEELISLTKESYEATDKDDRPKLTSDDVDSVLEFLDDQVGSGPIQNLNIDEVEYENESSLVDDLQEKVAVADMVQVPIRKLDALMNQVGQLIIERDRLMAASHLGKGRNAEYAGLQRITSDLQYSVMDVRLVQIGTLFSKFHRVARDVANIEGKEINLVIKGSEVEIDRNILKIMSDSMVHLMRNAVGHGIEDAAQRKNSGKPEIGTITMSARNEKDHVIIEVSDDGKGIDADQIREKILQKGIISKEYVNQLSEEEIIMYIFETGFSNAASVSEVSGRGVGMDVVKKSTESIGGQVKVFTKVGEGTTISLKLPASMAVKGVLMYLMGDQEYAIPLSYTEAVISLHKHEIHKAGIGLMSSYLKQTISIVFFEDLLKMQDFTEIYDQGKLHDTFDQYESDEKFEVIVVSYADRYYGIVVDKLLQQKEIIEKPMPKPLDNNRLLSGTTIMGNGNVCMIVDAVSITDILYTSKFKIQEHLNAS
ncbi:chemotaxis protein CheA [Reichenbachiella ulvae]|uniref:Chemotaxis protein CheA n=1 Tax=Reichenbachiella ulvae TaxID=2980104 RepID=A0ABT3CNR7_9BACT|nr:chemotaxis protein CheA [Reichenbachiella ulvae]MCV9385201.1 chemotaxis protein CheA [Reichenbachiella ulvae]